MWYGASEKKHRKNAHVIIGAAIASVSTKENQMMA